MADELFNVLTRFHREVVVPDTERIVDDRIEPLRTDIGSLRSDMLSHLDRIDRSLERLDMEYQALNAAVKRLE